MEESTTYQAIIEKGAAKGALQEARKMLLRLAERRFKESASTALQRRVEAIEDLDQLEQLVLRIDQSASWDELLPASHKPRGRRSSRR